MILLWDDQEQANWYYAEDSEGIPTLPSKATFFVWIPRVLQPNRLLSREAWTAQEDLWIQRELFTALRSANRQVARFASLGQAAAEPQPSASVTLANPYWKLDLKLVEHGKRLLARVTNRLDRKQPLDGVVFLVRVHPQGPPERLILGGEALPTGASRELPPHTLSRPASPAGILGVEQVLTWEAAAVKRLDYIRIGGGGITAGSPMGSTLSSRMLPRKLVAYPFPVASPENEPDAAKTAKTSSSPNGVVFTRYTEVTRQFRRVPVALSVIVDQNQVSNVLQALSSGRLPLVTHQVFLHRYPQRLRVRRGGTNRLAGEQTARPPGIPAKVPSVYWPDGQGSGLSLPGSAGGPDSAMAEGPATNMELVVYGVVTLFERYPPRTPDGEGAGADAADGDDS